MKTFDEFIEAISSGDLKDEYLKVGQDKEVLPLEERFEFIIGFAKDHGYDVSVEDLTLADADGNELDEKELAKVSGGGREKCFADYACSVLWNTCYFSDQCAAQDKCSANLGKE